MFIELIPFFVLANIARAGGIQFINTLPSRQLYWASVLIGLLAYSMFSPFIGVVSMIGYLIWGVLGWGLWFDLHRNDEDNAIDPRNDRFFESLVNKVSFGNDYVALFLRHAIFVIPFLSVMSLEMANYWPIFLSFPFGMISVFGYEMYHRTGGKWPLGEITGGILWWCLVVMFGLLT